MPFPHRLQRYLAKMGENDAAAPEGDDDARVGDKPATGARSSGTLAARPASLSAASKSPTSSHSGFVVITPPLRPPTPEFEPLPPPQRPSSPQEGAQPPPASPTPESAQPPPAGAGECKPPAPQAASPALHRGPCCFCCGRRRRQRGGAFARDRGQRCRRVFGGVASLHGLWRAHPAQTLAPIDQGGQRRRDSQHITQAKQRNGGACCSHGQRGD